MKKNLKTVVCICLSVLIEINFIENTNIGRISAWAAPVKNAEETDISIEGEDILNDIGVTTGTQENAKENEVNVDADIEEDVNLLVGEEWEQITIDSASDLENLAKNCRLDTWSRNKVVVLNSDISLLDSSFVTIPTFGGIFDGQGHIISGFKVEAEESNIGMFAHVQSCGTVKNLNVKGNIEPLGKSSVVGTIAGRNEGVISNCSFAGKVSANDYVGGIAGINQLSGLILDCTCEGNISGKHFTGGICGENMGNILRCTNKAYVNTTQKHDTASISDIDLSFYKELITSDTSDSAAMVNGIVDTGGIAGLSIGIIQHSVNEGAIGYEKLGYNVGGIAGRHSGYIFDCRNEGIIKGRKDIGGIVGQAEPYVAIDFSQDIAYQLSENISKLHDVISVTLNDAGNESDTLSNRLSIIQGFTNSAIEDTRYLADNSITWVDKMVSSANDVVSRIDYIMEESAKKDGVFDEVNHAASNSKNAAKKISDAVNNLDIYKYMTEDEQLRYDNARTSFEDALSEHAEYEDEIYRAYYNYYIDSLRYADKYSQDGETNENRLCYRHENGMGEDEYIFVKDSSSPSWDKDKYDLDGVWVHKENPEDSESEENPFPNVNDQDQENLDNELIEEAVRKTGTESTIYADGKYAENHGGHSYSSDIRDYSEVMTQMISKYSDQMSEDARGDAQDALSYIEDAAGNIEHAGKEARNIADDVNGREDIVLPQLGEEYRGHATNLNNALQGMSDNFGLLNNEMSGASDVLISDLEAVNDQFNTIMQLYTDALDGVLDMDYSSVIEDNSYEVAATCTDATVDLCANNGTVKGSINVSGIVGTMAIEYDYDLESDVTGIKEGGYNTTYLTKCVVRSSDNRGPVTGEKSNIGGICGLQEMGTILECGNYSKISSNSGDYVGGIAGSSVSHIVKSYEKGIIEGKSYVGGITGKGSHILDCISMPKINNSVNCFGAIAGGITEDGVVRNNVFASDFLAGIDRISYSKKAEPLEYEDIVLMEGIPSEFSNMLVTFVLDDEEDSLVSEEKTVLGVAQIPYGKNITADKFPKVPNKEGFYIKWDNDENGAITEDTEITATYERIIPTLAADDTANQKQSALLVDGEFKDGDKLVATLNPSAKDRYTQAMEYWEIDIPEDGHNEHTLRYGKSDNDKFDIYLYRDGKWEKIQAPEKMGKYYLIDTQGNHVKLQIVKSEDGKNQIIVSAALAVVALGVLILIFRLARKRKKQNKQ